MILGILLTLWRKGYQGRSPWLDECQALRATSKSSLLIRAFLIFKTSLRGWIPDAGLRARFSEPRHRADRRHPGRAITSPISVDRHRFARRSVVLARSTFIAIRTSSATPGAGRNRFRVGARWNHSALRLRRRARRQRTAIHQRLSMFAGGATVEAASHAVGAATLGGSWTLDASSNGASLTKARHSHPQRLHSPRDAGAFGATAIWISASGGPGHGTDARRRHGGRHPDQHHCMWSPSSANRPTSVSQLVNVALDTVNETYFLVHTNAFNDANIIWKGSLTAELNNPSGTPTLTAIYSLAVPSPAQAGPAGSPVSLSIPTTSSLLHLAHDLLVVIYHCFASRRLSRQLHRICRRTVARSAAQAGVLFQQFDLQHVRQQRPNCECQFQCDLCRSKFVGGEFHADAFEVIAS